MGARIRGHTAKLVSNKPRSHTGSANMVRAAYRIAQVKNWSVADWGGMNKYVARALARVWNRYVSMDTVACNIFNT